MVARYTAGAANLPFFPLRSYFETDLPVANPRIREIESPYGDGKVYAVPPLKPDVDGHPCPARRRRRRHPGLGPPRLPEGGGIRGGAGHRRGRGARRRGRHPRRPQPDDRPGPDRRRRRRRAVGRPPLVRPGRLRPRQPLLPRLGSRSAATSRDQAWLREWVHGVDGRAGYLDKLGDDRLPSPRPTVRRPLARSTTGRISERAAAATAGH